jgi:hypothetical protein
MSLLGVISKEPLRVRAGVANGSGWGCILQNAAESWRLPVFHGGKGAVAVHPSSEKWILLSSETMVQPAERQAHGDVVLGTISPIGREQLVRFGTHWAFAYEGSIHDADALQAALDPAWTANPALRTPGDLIFAHVVTYMAGVGALYASSVALAHASRDIWRARRLGAASFLYSDGDCLYGYSVDLPLAMANLADAIVVGSPDVIPAGFAIRIIPNGAVVSISRRPHLGWSTTVFADE